MTGPGPIAVSVLGAVTVTVAGVRVEPRGRRSRELLARLVAARGGVVSTDRLIDDLWAGEPPPTATNSLQVHVSHLRRALEPDRGRGRPAQVLRTAAPGYALTLPVDAVDLWRFEQLLRDSDESDDPAYRHRLLTAALACWSGEAFGEFADDDWTTGERTRVEQLRRSAVEATAETELALGRPSAAIDRMQTLVRDDPTREEAARLLALGLYRSGRQADALTVLRDLRSRLSDELGVDPNPRVQALEADILTHASSLDAPPAHDVPPVERPLAAHPAPPGDSTLSHVVGRDVEVDAIMRAADASRTSTHVVWIAGEAGDGKSTVVGAAAERLRAAGWSVTWGRCPEVEGAPPGWAWREVVDGLGIDVSTMSELTRQGNDLNPFLVAQEIGAALRERSLAGPALVVIEDAHRADDLTAQLLRQVIDALASNRVLVMVTYRASEATAPLLAARAATASVTADHLTLSGLDRTAVDALARSVELDADPTTLDLLVERTGGNPLFVRELARLLTVRGRGAAATAVPNSVADVVRARASRLPPVSVTALRQAAVLGREVDIDVVAAVTQTDVDDLLDALEAPVLAGLLHHAGADRVRFDHAIVRDTFYADTPALRRTRWHARAVTVLAERSPDALDALAYHAVASLRPDTATAALHWTRTAADRAVRVGAPAQAAELYRQALRAAELVTDRPVSDEVALRVAAVRAHARAADAVGGRALQREAVALAADDEDLLVAALGAWDAPLIWSVRTSDAPDDVLVGGLRRALDGPLPDPVRARLLCALFLETENLDDAAALDSSEQALRLARDAGDDRLLCAALNARAYAALGPDLADQGGKLAAELVDVAVRAGHADYEAAGHWLVFLSRAGEGDLVGAQRAVDRAVELAAGGQLAGLLGVLRIWRAVALVLAGHIEDGLREFATVSTGLADAGGANAAAMALVGRLVVAHAAGDLAPLVDELAVVQRSMSAVGVVHARALLDAGRPDEARTIYDDAPPIRRGYYWLGLTTVRAHVAARLGLTVDARALYAELLPWSGRIAGLDSGTMPLGPVDDALALCADLLGDAEAAERHRETAVRTREALAEQLAAMGIG